MTEYRLASGATVTDEDFERWATELEDDAWENAFHEIRIGRPPISAEELGSVTFKAPKSRIAAMEERAKAEGVSKSQFMRRAMELAMA